MGLFLPRSVPGAPVIRAGFQSPEGAGSGLQYARRVSDQQPACPAPVAPDGSVGAGGWGALGFGVAYGALTLAPVPKNVLSISAVVGASSAF